MKRVGNALVAATLVLFSTTASASGSVNNSVSLNWVSGGHYAYGCGDAGGSRAISDFYIIARGPHVRNGGTLTVNVTASHTDLQLNDGDGWKGFKIVNIEVGQDRKKMSVRAQGGVAINLGSNHKHRPWNKDGWHTRGFAIFIEKPSNVSPDYRIIGPTVGGSSNLPRPHGSEPGLGLSVFDRKVIDRGVTLAVLDRGCAPW